ncbi:MAG: phosphotransacetylase family protein [Bacillota bacterium]
MKSIFISGRFGSGKTAVCLAMALKLREEGLKVGYFKPLGVLPAVAGREDEDVLLMQSVCGRALPHDQVVLMHSGPQYLSRYHRGEDHLAGILRAHRALEASSDLVIIEGAAFPHIMASIGLDAPSLAREMGAGCLLVNSVEDDYSLDRMVLYSDFIEAKGACLLGVIFNNVPRPLLGKTEGVYRPLLEKRGWPVLGIIPRNVVIAAPNVKAYHDVLGGEILTGEDHLELLVEDVLVGAMNLEGALTYLRRAPNKAFITGGDRSDLALAALETSTSVIILTGGLYPDIRVISRAADKGVPVILVHHDTYTTIEKLREVSRKIRPGDERAIQAAKSGFERHVDWAKLKELMVAP